MNDKTTEQPIAEPLQKFREWLGEQKRQLNSIELTDYGEGRLLQVQKDGDKFEACLADFRALHSLPPSPVGEAGYENRRTAIAFNNFVKDGWVKYSDGWGNAYSNMRERYTDEQLYDLFVTNQPSPSRAGEADKKGNND